jgi:ATP-dependent RNA helicase RhlB
MKFTDRALHKNIYKGIEKAGFSDCLPVQIKTFEQTLDNQKDVCVQSQTGTGKTAAYLISVFQLLLTSDSLKKKKALIVAPTRELAIQITKEAQLLGYCLDLRIGCFYGGDGFTKQEALLQKGVDIFVGTPGRLLDFSQQGKLDFGKIGILIIDEADRLFDMGFLPDIRRMLRKMPPYNKRRTMLFSATLDSRVKELAWEHMNNPVEIEVTPEQVTVENVSQELYHVEQSEKMQLLLGILKKEQPKNVLIFTNTKHMAFEVSQRLIRNGYDCQYIMGDLPQKKRLKVIEGIKSGRIKYLVATEVAARGLHIDDLDLVINYDLPAECESYVHRIGRTARAGKSGKAITLACEQYVYGLEAIESYTDMKIPVVWADEAILEKDRSEGMTFRMPKNGKGLSQEKNTRPQTKRQSSTTGKRPPKKKIRKASPPSKNSDTRGKAKVASKKRTERDKGSIPSSRQQGKNKSRTQNITHPGRNSTPEQRLAYYKKKYGDNFEVSSQTGSETINEQNPAPKKSLFKKIVDFLAQ